MERIERADEDDPARSGARAAHRAQADLQPPGPLPQAVRRAGSAGRSEKLDLLDELLGTALAEDGSVLVFTQYVAMARLLEDHLSPGRGPPPVPARRHPGPRSARRWSRSFQAGPDAGGVPVFLLSLKAGGTGLNLTRADHVDPRRPLVEPRRRGPGDRPRPPDRPDPPGAGAPDDHRRAPSRSGSPSCCAASARSPTPVLGRGEAALTELSNDELLDLVSLRRHRRCLTR